MRATKKRAESILDFILAFTAILALVIGIARIWIWFHANYARQQYSFQQGRLVAGKVASYDSAQSELPIGAKEGCLRGEECTAKPMQLTEDWVFKGEPGESVTGFVGNTADQIAAMCKAAHPECLTDPSNPESYDYSCAGYVQCTCEKNIEPAVNGYMLSYNSLIGAKGQLEKQVKQLRDSANECDDPWELCWWGSWGKTAKELNNAANELQGTANDVGAEAATIASKISNMQTCCSAAYPTREQQDLCLLLASEGLCSSAVSSYQQIWQGYVDQLNPLITAADSEVGVVNNQIIPTCNGDAQESCTASCTTDCTKTASCATEEDPNCTYTYVDQACYDTCYATCYENTRNDCCQNSLDPGNTAYNRNCDTPASSCDDDCISCPACGLSAMASRIAAKNQTSKNSRDKLNAALTAISGCCGTKDPLQQATCINNAIALVKDIDLGS